MIRDFLTDEERKWYREQESWEEKYARHEDIKDCIGYTPKYDDYFREEVERQNKERLKMWAKQLIKERKTRNQEYWENRKKELYMLINEDMLEADIITIIQKVDELPMETILKFEV